MIRITFEYETIEQAILALGKQAGIAKVRRAAQAPVGAPPAASGLPAHEAETRVAAPAAPTTPRRGRSDKGKPRGSHKDNAAAVPAPAEGDKLQPSGVVPEAAPSTAAPAAEVAPAFAVAAPDAAVPSAEAAQKALEAVFEKSGLAVARDLMARHGVARLRELPAEKRAGFIAEAVKVAA